MMMDKDDHERTRDRDRGGRRDRPTRFSSNERDRSPDRGKDRGGMKSSNCRVYVSNIPYEYRWQDLKDLFREQVGEVSFVELFVDENDKARGCGIVEFAEPASAKKCLEVMHRFDLKGRKMVIKEDFGNQRDKYGNLIGAGKGRRDRDSDRGDRGRDERRYEQHGSSVGGSTGPIVGNTYGLSPAFLDDLKIQTPLNTRIFVANLEYKVDKKKLKEVFRMAGKVISVDMPLAKDGTSRGFAVIEYDHPVESVQAISMFNGQPLYDRPMTVRMDRGPERDKLPEGLKSIGNGLGSNGEPLRDVARNLPSLINQPPVVAANLNSGAGILGAVPNLQLGAAASALGSLSSSALNSLGSSQAAVLQAANLGLSNNLLASSLGGGDIALGAANLLQNNPSLAALAASSNSMNSTHNNFNRGDNQSSGGFMSNSQQGGGGGGNYGGGGASHNQSNMSGSQNLGRNSYSTGYESSKPQGGGYGGFGNNGDRDSRPPPQHNSGGNMYNSLNNGGSQMMRGGGVNMMDRGKCKLLISNLPSASQYKLITEKCQEFGVVENFEEQGVGSMLVTFRTEWDAERAMKNIDRARIDGRTIDARII